MSISRFLDIISAEWGNTCAGADGAAATRAVMCDQLRIAARVLGVAIKSVAARDNRFFRVLEIGQNQGGSFGTAERSKEGRLEKMGGRIRKMK